MVETILLNFLDSKFWPDFSQTLDPDVRALIRRLHEELLRFGYEEQLQERDKECLMIGEYKHERMVSLRWYMCGEHFARLM